MQQDSGPVQNFQQSAGHTPGVHSGADTEQRDLHRNCNSIRQNWNLLPSPCWGMSSASHLHIECLDHAHALLLQQQW